MERRGAIVPTNVNISRIGSAPALVVMNNLPNVFEMNPGVTRTLFPVQNATLVDGNCVAIALSTSEKEKYFDGIGYISCTFIRIIFSYTYAVLVVA